MQKSFIISALALCFSLTAVSANNLKMDAVSGATHVVTFKSNPFCVAIAKGDLDTVKKLVEYGEDVNQVSQGMTPLMYAAKYNRVEIVKYLISQGAQVDAKSNKGLTALKYAESTGAEAVVSLLEELS
jgi:ankyrin repeat protein